MDHYLEIVSKQRAWAIMVGLLVEFSSRDHGIALPVVHYLKQLPHTFFLVLWLVVMKELV